MLLFASILVAVILVIIQLLRVLCHSSLVFSTPFSKYCRSRQFSAHKHLSRDCLKGRVCLVTGATRGIGKQVAEHFAAAGATTLLGCRNIAIGRAVAAKIRAGCSEGVIVECVSLDLASPRSITACAEYIKREHGVLHFLVNNAGVPAGPSRPPRTVHGVEECLMVNHIGHFQLTTSLLPLLVASAPARVVHVSSSACSHAPKSSDWLKPTGSGITPEPPLGMMERYAASKLAQLAFSCELNRRLLQAGHQDVLSNAVHPGIVASEFITANARRNFGDAVGLLLAAFVRARNSILAFSVEQAADGVLYAAVSPEVNSGGKFFWPIGHAESPMKHPLLHREGFGAELWAKSENLAQLACRSELSDEMS
mmetsp:Transcript_11400/g.24371  ORF Transcript_11400/g.24371 Transcript_11400/m.24371 type:complete len:367 (+) Transcript_11400:104-1204(+)